MDPIVLAFLFMNEVQDEVTGPLFARALASQITEADVKEAERLYREMPEPKGWLKWICLPGDGTDAVIAAVNAWTGGMK